LAVHFPAQALLCYGAGVKLQRTHTLRWRLAWLVH
jgi:hypothetical protein